MVHIIHTLYFPVFIIIIIRNNANISTLYTKQADKQQWPKRFRMTLWQVCIPV